MQVENIVIKKVIKRLINAEDYRIEVINLINAEFLDFCIKFFKEIVNAKLENKNIDKSWYLKHFLNENLPKEEIAINSGLNMKTISNMYNSTKKEIVIEASTKHFEELYSIIEELINIEKEIDIQLTIKFNKVSVELNVSESLIVINTLAVKRAAIRGSLWSSIGKRVEKPLMLTLCKLFNVSDKYYKTNFKKDKSKKVDREVDFYLISPDNEQYRCEVKLMGKGNPESADAVYPRNTNIFIADKLSDQNKAQLDKNNIFWIELREKNGWRKFEKILEKLQIPHKNPPENIENYLDKILNNILNLKSQLS